jgi:hypothetical protein
VQEVSVRFGLTTWACMCYACVQERDAQLSELQHRLDKRSAELDELKASTNAALTRRWGRTAFGVRWCRMLPAAWT